MTGGSNLGASEQAQPTNIPSAERVKSSSSGESGQAPTESNKGAPSPNKSTSFSQSISSSQSGSQSVASGTSTSSSGPNTSSTSGTTSSSGGYPPSSSHSSDSPEDQPPSNRRGHPSSDGGDSGGGGDSSQPHPSGSSESAEQRSNNQDSSVGEDNMLTSTSELDASTTQGGARHPCLDQTSQTEGAQDSFLKRKDNSSSLSSREGGESGYIGGSSSVSVLASVSPSKSTPSSLSAPLATVSDSQETLESSVSCIEDSVPIHTNTAQTQSKLASKTTPNVLKSVQALAKGDELDSDNLVIVEDVDNPEASEGQDVAAEVSSELLPLEPPQSPELINNGDAIDRDDGDVEKEEDIDSPVIAFQGAELPRDGDESPVIALQSPLSSRKGIFKPTRPSPVEVDLEQEEEQEPEGSQAMETDMISTQNSFMLQLADSQCSLAPFSPFKQSQCKPVDSDGLSSTVNPQERNQHKLVNSDGLSSAVNSQDDEQDKNDDKQGSEVAATTNDKQVDRNISGKEADTDLESSEREVVTDSVASNERVSKGNNLPSHSAIRTKPIPLYESLQCDYSSSQASMNLPQMGGKETSISNQRLGELQDTSQITNSGMNECFVQYHALKCMK